MNEVSKKLRATFENWALGAKGPYLLLEAANEIDRLENENAQLGQCVRPAIEAAAKAAAR